MDERRRILLLVLIMVVVALVVGSVSILLLYQAALEQERARLTETVHSQARLLEAVARFDAEFSQEYPGGSREATLAQMRDAHERYAGFGDTGEFTLANREGDLIVFLLSHRRQDMDLPQPIPFDTGLAEPQRRALSGESGTMIGADYGGATVLAAYEPVAELGWGIVAKIDMAEVRAPYVRAMIIAALAALAVISLASLLFVRVTNPVLRNLEESEARFARAIEGTSDGLWEYNVVTGAFWYAPHFLEMFGYQPHEFEGTMEAWSSRLHPNDRQMALEAFDNHLKHGDPYDVEYRFRTGNGEYCWTGARGLASRDEQGNPILFSGANQDITERVRAEGSLAAERNLLRTVIDNLPDVIYAKDTESRFLVASAAVATLMGVEAPDDLLGKTDFDFHPPELASKFRADDEAVVRTGQPAPNIEEPVLDPQGNTRWLLTTKVPLRDSQGNVIGLVGIGRDITQRKQAESQRDATLEGLRESEERYRSLFENMIEGFAYCRMLFEDGQPVDFIYLDVNDAFETQTGLRDVVGKRVTEVIPDIKEATPGLFEIYGRVALTGKSERFEIYLEPLDMWLSISVYGPEKERFVAVFDVITERVQAESQRDAALEELQRYAERLRQLTRQAVSAQEGERHRVSRELHDETGQALTALKISLELLQSDLPPEAETLRQRLGAAVALTEETMEQMRLLAQDLRPPALDTVGLDPTLEGLCRDFAQRTQLAVDYDGAQLPLLPETADICLYRVLQEALTNVVRHADAGQVRVALGCDAQVVSLLVEDDGHGIDDQATLPAGIGLLGMRERLEMLDGQLKIESPPGGGTRLRASIPLHRTQAEGRKGDDTRSPG